MKYADLIQFEPIRSVVELRSADDEAAARDLVSSFVISDEMADKLVDVVYRNLRFETPADRRGVLIVGNYGTGKSHLMSVISAAAEHADLAELIRHPRARDAARPVAGRFKVVRTELSTTASLRDALCREIERALSTWGIDYTFPPQDQVANNKQALETMMEAFHARFPDHGFLLVVDELLDYLRHRMHQGDAGIILDLSFLREIGEIAADIPFRFVGGVQVSLFDNPDFQFVADALRRVEARFEQVFIAKRDVQFVVAERLLRKTADQQVKIRSHLLPFARFYEGMNERMDEFVRLFPVHPDYVAAFERITVAEKREVLKTISRAMEKMKERDVPEDQPGLLAFDSYWQDLRENAAFRTHPEIRIVLEASTKLEELVTAGYPKGRNGGLARRVIHGLSIHRLTVGSIEAPVGMTAEQLRDQLCLYDPMVAELGGEPSEDLRGEVETTLRLISRTVNGQFISATHRDASGGLGGQFYLDVRKTVDYDAQVERRAATLSEDVFDRRYFEVLSIVLERQDLPTVAPGSRIWEYELTWREKNAPRSGYLVFGAPSDRSTARPPRDFYLYFLQLYRPPKYADEKKVDEVFFRLSGADEAFRLILRRYAAALDLAATSAGDEKSTYERKAQQAHRELAHWLRENLIHAVEVTHRGSTRKMLEWVPGRPRERLGLDPAETANVRDYVGLVASTCLADAFAEQAGEAYPRFSILVTNANLEQSAQDALRGIRGGNRTKQADAVLDALELLDGERLDPRRSRYAEHLRTLLERKGPGQVVNRSEVITDSYGVEYMTTPTFRLEPEWVVVLAAALVQNGDVVLTVPGRKFTAGDLEALAATAVGDLVKFKHLEPPREWSVPVLRAVFELVGENPGQANLVAQGSEDAVRTLQARIGERVRALVAVQRTVLDGLPFWGRPLFSEAEGSAYRDRLAEAKLFLEGLQPYNNPAKLKNLRVSVEEVDAQRPALALMAEIELLAELVAELNPLAVYLAQARMVLPAGHPWVRDVQAAEQRTFARVRSQEERAHPQFRSQVHAELEGLKRTYVRTYASLHTRARLGGAEVDRRAELRSDRRLRTLDALAPLPVLAGGRLADLRHRLEGLPACPALTGQDLAAAPACPRCDFRPAHQGDAPPAAAVLESLDRLLDSLLEEWTATLLEALRDPGIRENLALLTPAQQSELEAFLESGEVPEQPEDTFVPAMRDLLAGLARVVIRFDALRRALEDSGAAAKPEEIRARFDRFMNSLLDGHDADRVRIVVEESRRETERADLGEGVLAGADGAGHSS